MVSRRSAKALVKPSGMCCTTRIDDGNSGGICVKTCMSAAGPPVEVPIPTIFELTLFSGRLALPRLYHRRACGFPAPALYEEPRRDFETFEVYARFDLGAEQFADFIERTGKTIETAWG